jgi:creatinine amidohydrolase
VANPQSAPGVFLALAELTYTQVKALLEGDTPTVALIAVGSVEAHGPHLPLGTDTMIADRVVEQAGSKLAERGFATVQFPTIPYAVTEWAAMFPGSTSISRETAEAMVLETFLAAHGMGFDHVVMANAHLEPDNIAMLRSVCRRFEEKTGTPLLFPDKTRRRNAQRLTAEFQSGSCHAGQYETSLVLAIAPELVDQDVASSLPRHTVALHEKMAAGLSGFIECGLPDAYCGAPAEASVEEGVQSLATLSDMMVEVVLAAREIAG